MTPTQQSAGLVERLECPACGGDSPSTEAFEAFGVVLCADCAADLFDPGDGFPDSAAPTDVEGERNP